MCCFLHWKSYLLNHERNMHRSSTVYKQNSPKQFIIKYVVDFDVTKGDGLFHWRNQSYGLWTCILGRCDGLKLKALMMFMMQLFTLQDMANWWLGAVWMICGLLWCYYQLFGLSFWRHPFTTMSKWRDATFFQICSDEETNSFTSYMARGRVHFQQIFFFCVN